jgi:hypothetical protein
MLRYLTKRGKVIFKNNVYLLYIEQLESLPSIDRDSLFNSTVKEGARRNLITPIDRNQQILPYNTKYNSVSKEKWFKEKKDNHQEMNHYEKVNYFQEKHISTSKPMKSRPTLFIEKKIKEPVLEHVS